MSQQITRRQGLGGALAAGASFTIVPRHVLGGPAAGVQRRARDGSFEICVFSKCLQWLDYPGMAAIAAEAGFDGLDLTVRQGGHVLPERVEEDLPKAVEAAAKAGMLKTLRRLSARVCPLRVSARWCRAWRSRNQRGPNDRP